MGSESPLKTQNGNLTFKFHLRPMASEQRIIWRKQAKLWLQKVVVQFSVSGAKLFVSSFLYNSTDENMVRIILNIKFVSAGPDANNKARAYRLFSAPDIKCN